MSNGMMNLVFDDKILKSTRRLLMLAIANSTNEDGHGVYGIDTLAADANLVPRQARRVRDELVADGLIFVRVGGGRGQLTNYLITLAVSLSDLIKRLKHYFDFDDSTAATTAQEVLKRRGTFLTKGDKKGDISDKKGGHDYAQKGDIPNLPHIPNTEDALEYKSAASPPTPDKNAGEIVTSNLSGKATSTPNQEAEALNNSSVPQAKTEPTIIEGTVTLAGFKKHFGRAAQGLPQLPVEFNPPPSSDVPPDGYEWRGIKNFKHLIKAGLKTPHPVLACGAPYDGLITAGPNFAGFIPCAACLDKVKPKSTRKPWTDLTDALHDSIPETIRPVGKPHYGKWDRSAKALYEAGFTADRVRAYVVWAYAADKWFCCGGAGGTPVMMTLQDVSKNIKGFEATKAGTNGTTTTASPRNDAEHAGLLAKGQPSGESIHYPGFKVHRDQV